MNDYIFVIIWIAIMAILSYFFQTKKEENVLGRSKIRTKVIFAIIVFFPIFWIASMGDILVDVWVYLSSFEKLPETMSGIGDYLSTVSTGKGFVAFEIFIRSVFGTDRKVFRIAIALVHSIPIALIYRKYSDNYLISIYLFLASCNLTGCMMNGLRQFMATTIIFAATPLLLKKKYIPLVAVILIACTVHSSAIIMLPMVFIVQGKSMNVKTMIYMLIAIVGTYIFSINSSYADALIEGTQYAGSIGEMQAVGDDGTNPLRVLVSAVPALMAIYGRKKIWQLDDPILNVSVNMSFMTVGIYLVSTVTSGILIGRLPIYTCLYSYLALPNMIPVVFSKRAAKVIIFAMIVLYLFYYIYQMHFLNGLF